MPSTNDFSGQQCLFLFPDEPVAFARDLFEAFGINYRHISPPVSENAFIA
jgi:hypothetical protein